MVRDTGFEPVTPSVSGKCSTTELTAQAANRPDTLANPIPLASVELVSKPYLTRRRDLVASTHMKFKWTLPLLACVTAFFLNGCVETVDGRHRAGMPFQNDRAEGRYPRSTSELWAAAKDVLKYHGTLSSEDVARQSLQGNVDEREVWMTVSAVDAKTSMVIVQARSKGGMADYRMATYLEKEIAVRLATGALPPKPVKQ